MTLSVKESSEKVIALVTVLLYEDEADMTKLLTEFVKDGIILEIAGAACAMLGALVRAEILDLPSFAALVASTHVHGE